MRGLPELSGWLSAWLQLRNQADRVFDPSSDPALAGPPSPAREKEPAARAVYFFTTLTTAATRAAL